MLYIALFNCEQSSILSALLQLTQLSQKSFVSAQRLKELKAEDIQHTACPLSRNQRPLNNILENVTGSLVHLLSHVQSDFIGFPWKSIFVFFFRILSSCWGTKTQILLKANGGIGALHNVVEDCMVPELGSCCELLFSRQRGNGTRGTSTI